MRQRPTLSKPVYIDEFPQYSPSAGKILFWYFAVSSDSRPALGRGSTPECAGPVPFLNSRGSCINAIFQNHDPRVTFCASWVPLGRFTLICDPFLLASVVPGRPTAKRHGAGGLRSPVSACRAAHFMHVIYPGLDVDRSGSTHVVVAAVPELTGSNHLLSFRGKRVGILNSASLIALTLALTM